MKTIKIIALMIAATILSGCEINIVTKQDDNKSQKLCSTTTDENFIATRDALLKAFQIKNNDNNLDCEGLAKVLENESSLDFSDHYAFPGIVLFDLRPIAIYDHIKALDLRGIMLLSLDGIEDLKKLEILKIDGGISGEIYRVPMDYSKLSATTNLRALSLENFLTDTFDISLIKNLTNLESLSLASTPFKNFEKIVSLSKLSTLDLSSFTMLGLRQINDYTPLQKLEKLSTINLMYTNFGEKESDIITNSNIKIIDLSFSKATKIASILNRSNIEVLKISMLKLTDLNLLLTMDQLKTVDVLDMDLTSADEIILEQLKNKGVEILK